MPRLPPTLFLKDSFIEIQFTHRTIYPLDVYNSMASNIFVGLCDQRYGS